MTSPTLKPMKISKLRLHLLEEHRFAVPKLQRNFVWDANRAAKLLDSVYYQMPIGSIFLWRMDLKSAHLIRQSTGVLPAFNLGNKDVWFVIDGQQRLSVIYQAFQGEENKNDSGRSIDFGRLCFAVNPDRERDRPQRIVYRKPADDFVPLRDILNPNWVRRMPNKSQSFLARIRDCRARILRYPLPVVTVEKASLAEIGDVFIRINRQGMRITNADRAIALMGELDVRAMAEELRAKVREGGFALGPIDPILMGFNLVNESPSLQGDPPKLEAMAHRLSKWIANDPAYKAEFKNQWHRYQNAFFSAVNYIRNRFPVYDDSYLPSANMLATLAVFFFHHNGQPNTYQRIEIRKWFWATGLATRYSGAGYHRNIVYDAKLFEALGQGKRRRFQFDDYLDALDIQKEEYNSGSARTRAFFCLLASLKPLFLDDGLPQFLQNAPVGYSNSKHRHHIFPKAQLAGHGIKAKDYNSLCNICFLPARDNHEIGMKVPHSYLKEYRDAGKAQFHHVMRSHLIPDGPDSGVWERGLVKGFKNFRIQRLRLICAAFEKEAGMRLFRKET